MHDVSEIISQLVAKFDNDFEQYRRPTYNETQTRIDFINPMFKALGWDMDNTQGYADAYRDVVHEDAIKIGGDTKAPDYSFRIGGNRKFFLEAKKPGVNLHDDPSPAFQLRRYAWSAKLSLSVLTDFEEFAVYDCRIRPDKLDKASTARVFYCTYDQYAEKWPEIAGIFARETILKGSFDKYADTTKKKRGTAEVDDAFLKQIEEFREQLARNVALRNDLSQRDLNFAVQRTIDRIIFLRICEDRGIEVYADLRVLLNGPQIYKRLCELYNRADDRYNSGLFHFTAEKERHESPDELTPSLEIDDKVLKEIISSLYYPDSPYEFSVLGADILGQVYEQFLGKVICLTKGGRASIEEKPEVRKAGGVYYTPTYIVDYIVANTLGKLVEGKTPNQVAKLRVLDPACGSGSFLIGAYQFLLDWHIKWYAEHDPQSHAKGKKAVIYQGRGGWRLTTAARKQILLNNIYGVDIDTQAVEVTKLSLVLKVLEGETGEGINNQLRLFHERALPDLGDNIKCGNSLIGPDFYDNEQMLLLDDEEKLRVNVLDWKKEFAPAMKAGGFDAVIGNPPYVLLQILDQRPVFDYLSKRYQSARYKIDTYHVFVEKGLTLAKLGGFLGYIIPNSFLRNKHAMELRNVILTHSNVEHLRLYYHSVFKGASVDTLIFIANRSAKPNSDHMVLVTKSNTTEEDGKSQEVRQKSWNDHPEREFGILAMCGEEHLLRKVQGASVPLGLFATAYFGIQTFDRNLHVSTRPTGRNWKPVVDGGNITRYALTPPVEYVDFRPQAIKSGGNQNVYEQERIAVRQIGAVPIATFVQAGVYTLNTVYNIFFTKSAAFTLKFVQGLISSKLIQWYWRHSCFDQKRTFPKVKKAALLSIPVFKSLAIGNDKVKHARMVTLVDHMLKLHEKLAAAKPGHGRDVIQRQIDATDTQIDKLVYDLYGLTEDEIKLVEEAT